MGSLATRAALLVWLVCLPVSAARAGERLPLFPSVWWVETLIHLHGAVDDGVSFSLPPRPLLANVILDAESGRFGISLLRPNELWLLQVGALELDRRGQPRLAPDDLIESGVVELVCAELAQPAPCDAPLASLAIEVVESTARARIGENVLRLGGRLRLVIFDPSRPELRIRVGVAFEGRAERPPLRRRSSPPCARPRSRSRAKPRLPRAAPGGAGARRRAASSPRARRPGRTPGCWRDASR